MAQDRLLDTAVREFGTHGLEGVSTRQIAKAAGTAMSTITYHYGGKDGLYFAAAERVATLMADEFAAVLDAEDAIGDRDEAEARAAIHRLMGRMVERMAGPGLPDQSKFIAREQMDPTAAFQPLYDGVIGRLVRQLRRLTMVVTGADERAATFATLALLGQAMVLRSSRGTVLRLAAIDTIDADWLAGFREQVAHHTDAILDRLIQDGPSSPTEPAR